MIKYNKSCDRSNLIDLGDDNSDRLEELFNDVSRTSDEVTITFQYSCMKGKGKGEPFQGAQEILCDVSKMWAKENNDKNRWHKLRRMLAPPTGAFD